MKELVRHRAFRVFLSCMLLQGTVFGIINNCFGVFTVAICEDCGFSRGDFGVVTTLRMISNALAILVLPRLLYSRWKYKLRYSMTVLGSLLFLSYGAGAFLHDVRAWYVAGILMGIGMSTFVVHQAYILGNWFAKYTNLMIGLSAAATGVAGMLLNPLTSALIAQIGWRYTMLLYGGFGVAVVWLTNFRMHYTPQEEGLQPFGEGEAQSQKKAQRSIPASAVRYSPAVLAVVALLVLFPHCMNETASMSVAYLPTYGVELGYDLTTAALFAAFAMVGNMAGKIIVGMMFDRMDWRVATCVFEGTVLIAITGLMLSRSCLPLTLFFCAMVGMIQCSSGVLMNAVARHVFGGETYVPVFSAITSISFCGVAVLYAQAGYSFDATGSFRSNFQFIITALSIALALMPVLFTLRRRFGKETQIVQP